MAYACGPVLVRVSHSAHTAYVTGTNWPQTRPLRRYTQDTASSSRSIATSFDVAICISGTSGAVGVTRRLTAKVGESLTASRPTVNGYNCINAAQHACK